MTEQDGIAPALAARRAAARETEPMAVLEARLRHAEKLEALSQMTGGIAHDFNNLLLAINFNLEALAEEVPQTPTTAPLFDGARRAIDRAQGLIGHLLACARPQSPSPVSFDVNQSVLEILRMLRRAIPAAIEIETRLGRGAGRVLADRNQFQTALLNLVFNARDAMPEGGRLTIVTADVTLDEARAALLPGAASGRHVLVAVSDSGAGMPPETAERAFEPFFIKKSGPERSGLGLSQVHGFAKQSGGSARIDSEPGRGTTVRLLLPRLSDAAAAAP